MPSITARKNKKDRHPCIPLHLNEIIGESVAIKASVDLLSQAASCDINVCIGGETGTGKELFARAIHNNSTRRDNRIVVIDCAALPETLVESILFGNVKGAFTGADRTRAGLIQHADGGSLFLDEIGELSLQVQKTFLRILEERRYRPLGSNKEINSDFRLITASNRDLDELVRAGQFRPDLLYRIKMLEIVLPPLRVRREDIRPIALYHLLKIFNRRQNGTKEISPDFFEALTAYDWPGNVRELVNALETAVVASGSGNMLYAIHLPSELRYQIARANLNAIEKRIPGSPPFFEKLPERLPPLKAYRKFIADQGVGLYLNALMSKSNGDIKTACKIAQIKHAHLYSLLNEHGLSHLRSK